MHYIILNVQFSTLQPLRWGVLPPILAETSQHFISHVQDAEMTQFRPPKAESCFTVLFQLYFSCATGVTYQKSV